MARGITDLDNYVAPGGDYPNGRVKDNPGDNTGTKVNEKLVGDPIQFFNKLMQEAGITPNGLPDNDYTGYQLYEAFIKVVGLPGPWHYIGSPGEPTFQNSWTNLKGGIRPLGFKKVGNLLHLSGTIKNGASGTIVFTLPVGYRPYYPTTITLATAGASDTAYLEIFTNGDVKVFWSTQNDIYIENTTLWLDA